MYEQARGGRSNSLKRGPMLFKHVFYGSIADNEGCLLVLGIIIGAARGINTEKRIFSLKGNIIDTEIFKGDIHTGKNGVNEAASSGITDNDIPIAKVRE